ncbi:MAG: Asp-tRNA(Asn)/Glu-tRNA(Gln) amidotransferase subunit GatA [Candidatus Berkelbacteria bacterium]|nr:Asp-tRNA(Asn)/Glu-tRNA(Gln) amidotransferase subunit GatA [Candidatus Berkelbacteria bacterium]MCR4307742.1 Asp-tRNA(Asn)/Glu-tRNA(Gln) amidotransferase subunit GatA [Candidatus Berkelbacteria bacterium]
MSDRFNAFLHSKLKPLVGSEGPLLGTNIAIKDNILVKDWPATAGSKILEGFIAPYDATVIRRLKESGATLVGKTNLDEFAMGSSTENSAFGPTKNPWDIKRVPGGSSGGSAAAVAADLCDVALGSDTGGSVRQPAAFCGVTGLKPTYGSVSRYGLIALASSLDVIGPFARDAKTVEKVFSVISGADKNDQTTIDYNYKQIEIDLSKLKVGLPKELWELSIDPEIKAAVRKMVDWLAAGGAKIVDVSLPSVVYALPAYYVILPAECSANLSRYDGIRYQQSVMKEGQKLLERYMDTRALFGSEVKRRILIGTFALSVGHYDAYYQTAINVKDKITADHERVFKEVDILLTPTTPGLPFEFGAKNDPVEMYQSDLLTVAANLAGVPGLSLPCGFSKSDLPIGAQLIGAKCQDNLLLSVAKQYQEETDFHLKKPRGI